MGWDDEPEANDTDLALRHLSQLLPHAMLRGLSAARANDHFESWVDTQLAQHQRRLDRAIVASDGRSKRVLHVEWERSLRRGMGRRVFAYNAMLSQALSTSREHRRLPVLSTVVLLTGREERYARKRVVRLSELHTFRYYLDAVYQRSVRELVGRGSVLWLAFTPLARDATATAMADVVRAIRRQTRDEEAFADLAGTMLILADADGRRRTLRRAIVSLIPSEVVMQSWVFRQGIAKGIEQGIEQGIERGIERGIEQGIAKGVTEGLALVVRQFERKLARPLREDEHVVLRHRLLALGGARLGDLALDLNGDELDRWLNNPEAT